MDHSDVIDISSAKERFMGNYAMFSRFLFEFPNRALFGDLEAAIDQKDVSRAFELAHAMKGVTGNLSMKLIEKPLFEVVEATRAGNLPSEESWQQLKAAYSATIDAIASLKESGEKLF